MDNKTELILEYFGWEIECENPLEISNKEMECFASGYAAEIVIDHLKSEYYFIEER